MSWLAFLIELHSRKDAAYGDAWCRRGEAAGIFPNIARKYDRWARIQTTGNTGTGDVEALDDTLADLTIYAVKYALWLRERHHSAPSWMLATCDTVEAALSELAHQPTVPDASALLVQAFAALEVSFVHETAAQPDSATAARGSDTWDLARSAWTLLQQLPGPNVPTGTSEPGTLTSGTSPLPVPGAVPNSSLGTDLLTQLLPLLATKPGPVLLLGRTADALLLRSQLHHLGIANYLVGIADPDIPHTQQPGMLGWAQIVDTPLDYVMVASDENKEALLRRLAAARSSHANLPTVLLGGMAHLSFRDEVYEETDAPAMVPSYATGYPHTRIHMFQHLQAAATNGLSGAIVEFGAFKGGTTAWLARSARRLGLDVPILAFDSWDGFPPRRSALDMYEHPRCVFRDLPAVRSYLEPLGIELVEGDISVTAARLRDTPVLLGFIDTDNYSPAHAALTAIADNVVPGGAIVFDHYTTTADYLYTLGERMAGQDVLTGKGFLHIQGSGVFLKLPTQGAGPSTTTERPHDSSHPRT